MKGLSSKKKRHEVCSVIIHEYKVWILQCTEIKKKDIHKMIAYGERWIRMTYGGGIKEINIYINVKRGPCTINAHNVPWTKDKINFTPCTRDLKKFPELWKTGTQNFKLQLCHFLINWVLSHVFLVIMMGLQDLGRRAQKFYFHYIISRDILSTWPITVDADLSTWLR